MAGTSLETLDAVAGRKPGATPAATKTGGLAKLDAVAGRPVVPGKAPLPPVPAPKLGIFDSLKRGAGDLVEKGEEFLHLKPTPPVKKKAGTPGITLDSLTSLSGTTPDTTPAPHKGSTTLDSLGKPPGEESSKPLDINTFGPMENPDFAVGNSTPETTPPDHPIIDTLRAFPRDFAAIGSAIGQAAIEKGIGRFRAAPGANTDLKKTAEEAATIPTDSTWWSGFLFGKDPIPSIPDTAANYEQFLKTSDFAKKYGLDKHATALGVLGATVPISLDFTGFGGEEGAIKALVKTSDVSEAARILRTIGVHEDLILPTAEHIAGTKSAAEIKGAIKSVEAIQKATTVIHAGATGLDETLTKGAEGAIRGDSAVAEAAAETIPKGVLPATDAAREALPKFKDAPRVPKIPTRPISVIQKALDDMVQQESFLADTVSDHPGRVLRKFASRTTGDLPEFTGKDTMKSLTGNGRTVKTSQWARRGDDIFQDLVGQEASGGGDVSIAQQRLEDYRALVGQHQDTKAAIRALRQEFKDAKAYATAQAKESAVRAKKAAKTPFTKDIKTREEKQEGTLGDYLRRGAEVARNSPPAASDGVVRGTATANSQRAAILESIYGGIESGPFKGFSEHLRNWFQDWIFARQSVDVEAKVALKKFETFKGQDAEHFWNWISEYLGKGIDNGIAVERTRPLRAGMFGEVSDLLERWLTEEQAAGIKVAEKGNYLPIYLKNAADRSEETLSGDRRVGLRPGFSLRSEFKDYVEAKAAGYEPAFTNLYDILRTRARAHYKALADAEFFREGAKNGWIVPDAAVDPQLKGDFSHLDSERFPAQRALYGNTAYQGVYSAPSALARKINAYLGKPLPAFQKIADVAGATKSAALSVGIPNISALPGVKQLAAKSPTVIKDVLNAGSGLVVHFWNVLPREIALDVAMSPVRAPLDVAKYMYYGLNPNAAARYLEKNMAKGVILARNGMKLTTEDQGFKVLGEMPESIGGKAGKVATDTANYLHHLFGENFFQKIMPARKLENGIRLMESYMKHGFPEKEAARMAAGDMNVIYGGINWESLGRDRTYQSVLRSALLAPDYLETNIKQGGRIAKALINPRSIGGKVYRGMMAAYVGSYLIANVINHENSGHWMYQNDILHQFSIDLGKDPANGKTRYMNIYGTAVEFLRIPLYTATAIAKGNYQDLQSILLNRLSVPFASVGSLIFNVDWKGDPILGPDNYNKPQTGLQQAQNVFDNTLGRIIPGGVAGATGTVQGKTGVGIGIAKTLGLPLTEKNTNPTPADINKLKLQAAADVKKGDYRLLNKLVKAGVITPRAKARFIRQALSGPTEKQLKAKDKKKAKNKQTAENLSALGL